MMNRMIRTYSELIRLPTLEERFEYLKLGGSVGKETFGLDRIFNQLFYTSEEWRSTRSKIIARDMGNDLAVDGYEIVGIVIVHHINPISLRDIETHSPMLFDEENLISTAHNTHNAIHYSDASLLPKAIIERRPGDTCLWNTRTNV
jgi:hypothetical protein